MSNCSRHRVYSAGCKDCQKLASASMRRVRGRNVETRKKVKGRWVSTDPRCKHGTNSGYNNYLCRCEPCTAAHRR